MRTNTLALLLTLVASLLVACGGDVRSPDRPSSRLDPDSLRIKFTPDKQLPGTGNSSISVRMLATRTNGVEVNLGPELNVTADTQWFLGGVEESLEFADLASEIRDAGQLGNVLDILSTKRLESTDSVKNLTIIGQYSFEGTPYKITEPFTIVPPISVFDKYIAGQRVIAVNPSSSTATTTENYQLLQKIEGAAQPENSTANATFCSDNVNFVFGETQSSDSGATVAPATITNPFTNSDQTQVAITIRAIEEGVPCGNDNEVRIATLIVNIIPATVSSLAVCAVANPADDVCSSNLSSQSFLKEKYLSDCEDLGNTPIELPAAQRLQLFAKLTYTNPQNLDQPPFIAYQCSAPNALVWSASPTAIFSEGSDATDGPDATDGDASLISRQDYETLPEADRKSTVTATYTKDIGTADETTISDSLNLLLINAEVDEVSIMRDGGSPTGGTDTIFLTVFEEGEGIDYTAMCRFINLDSTETINCPDALVNWEVDKPSILKVEPAEKSNKTTVSSFDNTTSFDNVILTAVYSGSLDDISGTRSINVSDDAVVELHLYQQDADVTSIDEFSCVGRTDLVGTLDNGETYIRGNQQFRAFALFESDINAMTSDFLANPTADGSPLRDLTVRKKLVFTSIPGYWSGNDSEPPRCESSLTPPEVDTSNSPAANTPAASFGETKGSLESRGLLRLSTVCIQAFIDSDSDGFTDGDVVAEEGSTVLVLPAANDDLLMFSNTVCEAFENDDGTPNQQALALAYTFSTIADPILSALATNDDGGQIPVEAIIQALITGDFSTIGQDFPNSPEGGLGRVTSEVLGAAAE
ncbi:MAG: hypothetical protein ACI9SK_001614 [Zhongshania sp.]|jgi:hypothetical protein